MRDTISLLGNLRILEKRLCLYTRRHVTCFHACVACLILYRRSFIKSYTTNTLNSFSMEYNTRESSRHTLQCPHADAHDC